MHPERGHAENGAIGIADAGAHLRGAEIASAGAPGEESVSVRAPSSPSSLGRLRLGSNPPAGCCGNRTGRSTAACCILTSIDDTGRMVEEAKFLEERRV